MKMGEHHGSVQEVDRPNGKHRGVCACGWESNSKDSYGDADIALQDHIAKHTLHGDEGGRKL